MVIINLNYLKMKFRLSKILFIVGIISIIFSCDEEERGPIFSDGIAPNIVTEVIAEAISGGARISYKLPDDSDLLLVRAEYTLANGETAKVRATSFNNSLDVIGLLDSIKEHKVTLYTEDKGGNESAPVTINIKIKEAPIYKAAKTIKMIPDFGGVRLFWSNPALQNVTLRMFTPDASGNPVAIYTDVKNDALQDTIITRGFSTDLREFKVVINDRWGNKAEAITTKLEPLFEGSVPKSGWVNLILPHDIPDQPGFDFAKMWDGAPYVHNKRDWLSLDNNGTSRDPDPLPEYKLPKPESHLVTIDLGRSVKLSRFKYWQDTPYQFGAIRFFDFWGTNETPNAEGTLDGWRKILSHAEVLKLSGERRGITTQLDLDTAANGDEFIIPLEEEPVRYVRFALLENYIGTVVFTGQEFEFFGQFE